MFQVGGAGKDYHLWIDCIIVLIFLEFGAKIFKSCQFLSRFTVRYLVVLDPSCVSIPCHWAA